MRLDPTVMRTMSRQSYRVLTAVESGMRNHALVPAPLIASIANLRHGGASKILSALLRDKLLSHDQSCGYDGYRLTNAGYDILALNHLKTRGVIGAFGDRIGTGKESDIYLAATPGGKQVVLKFHRLGRTSFRNVKKKRDYFAMNALSKSSARRGGGGGTYKQQQFNSWLFLSRVSALKEYAFMKALHNVGYPTPTPISHNRHVVVMSLIRGVPLYQLHSDRVSAEQAQSIFEQSVRIATNLVKHGLVHCDLNEFNLLVDLSGVQNKIAMDDDYHDDDDDDDGDNAASERGKRGGGMEHYVRHSGMSVTTPGALSAHGPLQKHSIHAQYDGTGEIITEEPPEPTEFLENGEPKPIVTLIDFPQMVSTRHPNAKELFERDWKCLKKFFAGKLRCVPPSPPTSTSTKSEGKEDGWDYLIPSWEELVGSNYTVDGDVKKEGDNNKPHMEDGEKNSTAKMKETGDYQTAVSNSARETMTCLASRAQLRLDEELRASGFTEEDSNRDAELYYYYHHDHQGSCNVDRRKKEANSLAEEEDDTDDGEGSDEDKGSDADEEGVEEDNFYRKEKDEDSSDDDSKKDDDSISVKGEDDNEKEKTGDFSTPKLVDGVPGKTYCQTGQTAMTPIGGLENNDDEQASAAATILTQQSWAVAESRAKERVRRQFEMNKKKERRKNAFRSKNSNKTYVKGKRVMMDVHL